MLNMTTMSALRFALVRAYKQWEGNMKGRTVGGLTDALRNCFAKCLINLRNFNSTSVISTYIYLACYRMLKRLDFKKALFLYNI